MSRPRPRSLGSGSATSASCRSSWRWKSNPSELSSITHRRPSASAATARAISGRRPPKAACWTRFATHSWTASCATHSPKSSTASANVPASAHAANRAWSSSTTVPRSRKRRASGGGGPGMAETGAGPGRGGRSGGPAGRARGGGGGGAVQRLDGGLDRGELPEHLVGPRQLDDHLHGPAHAREHHLPADGRELAVQREDDAEAGGVEDAGAGEVEDEVAHAGADVLLATRLELGRVAEVERLADADDGEGGGGLLDREAHGGGGWRGDGGAESGRAGYRLRLPFD